MVALTGHWALSVLTVDACGLLLLVEDAMLVRYSQEDLQIPIL